MKTLNYLFIVFLSASVLSSCMSGDEKVKIMNRISDIQTELVQSKSKLEAARDEMNRIKEFQIGRTQSERTEQIRQESEFINGLETRINNLNRELSQQENLLK